MKKIKRMMAMAIAIAIILSLGVSNMAFGAVPTTQSFDENNAANADGKYTISVASGDTHTYQVFQILKGTLVPGESKLGNPQWGSDANATTTYANLKTLIIRTSSIASGEKVDKAFVGSGKNKGKDLTVQVHENKKAAYESFFRGPGGLSDNAKVVSIE